mmetsp:Transcript_96116/g.256921  ORF Transcript_96116/g.256921 Transcript_96116/m.256921 type:complete len:727 (+) Transcript_96116:45-2225(+)
MASADDLPKDSGSQAREHTAEFSQGGRPEWMEIYEPKPFVWTSLVPPVEWLPAYMRALKGTPPTENDKKLQGDLQYSLSGDAVAGLTVGFMLVPQCLAFALLAGLPLEVGLYASFVPLVMYSLFGTIRQVQAGPTALMSLLTGSALDSAGLEDPMDRMKGAALLAAITGLLSVLLGVVRFGFIVDFMSHSVMTAFCSAAGITIATSQVKHLLGVQLERHHYWWQTFGDLVAHIPDTHGPTVAMGGTLLGTLLFLKYWKSAGNAEKRAKSLIWRCFPRKREGIPFRLLKTVADLSSLLCVIIGWMWGLVYRETGVDGVVEVRDSGEIDAASLSFLMPGDGVASSTLGKLMVPGVIIAVVGFLETVAVGGKFAMAARYEYEPNQELLALGIANLASAIMSGYPVTGSFSRTAVNAMFGASSLVACLVSSMIVLLAILVLLPVVKYLPLASLAPIIIQGAIGVVSFKEFRQAYHASRRECGVMVATFVVSLGLTVKEGLGVGFALSILKTMHELANPNMAVVGMLGDGSFRDIRNHGGAVTLLPTAVVVRMDARLNFVNARKMKDFAVRAVQVRERKGEKIDFVVIDCFSINNVDLTGCETLEQLAQNLELRGQKLVVANVKGPVAQAMKMARADKHIEKHGGSICTDMKMALQLVAGEASTADAAAKYKTLVDSVDSATAVKNASTNQMIPAVMKGLSHHGSKLTHFSKGSADTIDEGIRTSHSSPQV